MANADTGTCGCTPPAAPKLTEQVTGMYIAAPAFKNEGIRKVYGVWG